MLAVCGLVSVGGFAHSYPDEVAVCYQFKGDKLIDTGVCIVSSGGGAGGFYTNIKWNNKEYLIETDTMQNDNPKTYLNGKKVKEYYRSATFLDKTTLKHANEFDQKILYCYKTKRLNICHN